MASKAASTIWRVDIDRLIYTTITLMSVLIIYDGWGHLSFAALVGVILGPVVAMFLSHVFSTYLAQEVARGRAPSMRERMAIVRTESRFLLIAVPPLALAGLLMLLGVELSVAIRWIVALGVVSLGLWGGVAARRAGLTGWRVVSAVMAGLLIGATILLLQVALQPGRAASGGAV